MKSNSKPKRKGYSFKPSKENLEAFKGLSPEEKLQWLEDVNEFVNAFLSDEKLALWKKFCKGQY
ncbi:MAG TPA: hypothetical protein ACFYD6_04705 [Candidatus Brocadiia bacterium]|nr:hypothetical protein [Planctomycetota bacterium]MDO8092869.1 hypothetical protein [Candidatus Brocadiales bacterium]